MSSGTTAKQAPEYKTVTIAKSAASKPIVANKP